MKLHLTANPDRLQHVVPDMEPINELHLTEPGLVVVDVAATDDRTTRDPGQPGVRLRCYPDLRQNAPPMTVIPTGSG